MSILLGDPSKWVVSIQCMQRGRVSSIPSSTDWVSFLVVEIHKDGITKEVQMDMSFRVKKRTITREEWENWIVHAMGRVKWANEICIGVICHKHGECVWIRMTRISSIFTSGFPQTCLTKLRWNFLRLLNTYFNLKEKVQFWKFQESLYRFSNL